MNLQPSHFEVPTDDLVIQEAAESRATAVNSFELQPVRDLRLDRQGMSPGKYMG